MLKWVIELSEYEIMYQPRLSLKGQVMVDFIVELPKKPAHPVDPPRGQWWTFHVNEASRASGFGIGPILQSPPGELLEQVICLNFSTSNNEKEYEVVLVGLDHALTLATTRLEIRSDSQLIVRQIRWEYETRDERMTHYLTMVKDRLKKLDKWNIRWVPRKENMKVDALAGITDILPIKEVVILLVYL